MSDYDKSLHNVFDSNKLKGLWLHGLSLILDRGCLNERQPLAQGIGSECRSVINANKLCAWRHNQARRHGFRAGGARKIWRALSLFFDDYGAL